MTTQQLQLPVSTDAPLAMIREDHPNVDWLVTLLIGRDWTPTDEILRAAGKPVNEYGRRWVRRLAQRSRGRVLGQPGQSGYKLTTSCTHAEYQHWRNAMKSQADEMTTRILSADRVFYARQPVPQGRGILDQGAPAPEFSI